MFATLQSTRKCHFLSVAAARGGGSNYSNEKPCILQSKTTMVAARSVLSAEVKIFTIGAASFFYVAKPRLYILQNGSFHVFVSSFSRNIGPISAFCYLESLLQL